MIIGFNPREGEEGQIFSSNLKQVVTVGVNSSSYFFVILVSH